MRHLAKLLAESDLPAVREALAAIRGESRQETARLHRAERWRDRLIAEGDGAVGRLTDAYPEVDRQRVREHLRGIKRERSRNAPPRQFRALLRYLRALDGEAEQLETETAAEKRD